MLSSATFEHTIGHELVSKNIDVTMIGFYLLLSPCVRFMLMINAEPILIGVIVYSMPALR